jgi:ribonuclease HII
VSASITSLKARAPQLTEAELAALGDDSRAGVRALAAAELRRRQAAAAEAVRLQVMLEFEREHWELGAQHIAGVDEAGAGPWAGPVVAGAVILPKGETIVGVNDSKKLSEKQRVELAAQIRERAVAWAVGSCSAEEIDTINIKEATRLAMKRAVDGLAPAPDHLLVDWRQVPDVAMTQTILVRGDSRSLSIAAASILAKTHRDEFMAQAALTYPGYGFDKHVGYGTAVHLEALHTLGACPIHRRTFKPVARVLGTLVEKPKKKKKKPAKKKKKK